MCDGATSIRPGRQVVIFRREEKSESVWEAFQHTFEKISPVFSVWARRIGR